MANQTGARVRAVLTYYRVKYPTLSVRIDALRADYLAAYEADGTEGSRLLTSFSANGQSANWAVGLSPEERLDALAQALEALERGTPSGYAQGRVC